MGVINSWKLCGSIGSQVNGQRGESFRYHIRLEQVRQTDRNMGGKKNIQENGDGRQLEALWFNWQTGKQTRR